ncbi:hypothetical protein VH567_11960 [Sphingomonas sp. 4RDLI-65]|uniref:hypothetical protein n=1 Tax=Sphingomonas sp. 4RDLI-65 TaxID=3111641 RepID=UPI003C140335
MVKAIAVVMATLILGPMSAAAIARDNDLSDADKAKVVCVPRRTVDGAVTADKICRTGAQWEAALKKPKRRSSDTDFADQAQRGSFLARRGPQTFGSRPVAKPF